MSGETTKKNGSFLIISYLVIGALVIDYINLLCVRGRWSRLPWCPVLGPAVDSLHAALSHLQLITTTQPQPPPWPLHWVWPSS